MHLTFLSGFISSVTVLCATLLLSACAPVSERAASAQANVGQYTIQNGNIYGPRMSGSFYILNRYIYGPKNSGIYYVQTGYDPKGPGAYYIHGPKKSGLYYIQNNAIFGPPGVLPWMEDER